MPVMNLFGDEVSTFGFFLTRYQPNFFDGQYSIGLFGKYPDKPLLGIVECSEHAARENKKVCVEPVGCIWPYFLDLCFQHEVRLWPI